MEIKKNNLIILILISVFTSCSDDDTTTNNPTESNLTINLQTAEDQIGDFACSAMTLFNNNIWSIGGVRSATSNFNDEVWRSSDGIAWLSVSNNIENERCGHTLTTFNNKMWLIGGEDNNGNWLADIWSSSDGTTWINNFETAPFGNVAYHDTAIFNNKLYVIAADADTGDMKIWSSSDGEIWTEDTNNAFPARVSHKTVVFNDALYVIGGEGGSSNIRLNEIWTSTDGVNWSIISNNASIFPEINWHTATVYNNKVWIIGGRTNTSVYTNDIYYSENIEDWTRYTGLNPIDPITQHATLLYDNALWVFGGSIGFEETTGKIWRITEN